MIYGTGSDGELTKEEALQKHRTNFAMFIHSSLCVFV